MFDGCILCGNTREGFLTVLGVSETMVGGSIKAEFPQGQFPDQSLEQSIRATLVKKLDGEIASSGQQNGMGRGDRARKCINTM